MQSTENDLRSAGAIPIGQFVGAPGKGQVHGDANDLGHGIVRRPSMQQVLVPIFDAPVGGRGGGEAGQGQSRSQHVLAKAGVGILGIEGVDQQSVAALHESTVLRVIENGCMQHFRWDPPLGEGADEGFLAVTHAMYFILQSTLRQDGKDTCGFDSQDLLASSLVLADLLVYSHWIWLSFPLS